MSFLPLSKQSNISAFSWKAGPLPYLQITNPLLQPSPKAKLHSLLANSAIYLSYLSLQLTLCISLAKRTLLLIVFPARPPCRPPTLPPATYANQCHSASHTFPSTTLLSRHCQSPVHLPFHPLPFGKFFFEHFLLSNFS